jgi:hypothetical protein
VPGLVLVAAPLALVAVIGLLLAAILGPPLSLARIVLRSRSRRRGAAGSPENAAPGVPATGEVRRRLLPPPDGFERV